MPTRFAFLRPSAALLLAAGAFAVGAIDTAEAQIAGLRAGQDPNAFPGSPQSDPAVSPERILPLPNPAASPVDADEIAPPSATTNQTDNGAPNYGKPRKPKGKLYRPNPKTSIPLSPLVPYRGAPGPQRRLLNPTAPTASPTAVDIPETPPTVAVLPSPLRLRKPPVEVDPFVPIGVALGPFRLAPFAEFSSGYETNPNQVQTGVKPSAALRVDAGFALASDFARNSVTANLRGGYSEFPSNSNANRPDASGVVDGRFDISRDNILDTEARFNIVTQTPGSPLLAVPNSVYVTSRPLIVSEGATLGATHVFNRLSVGLRGTFDRVQYGDATQSDGTTYLYSQDNYNDYGIVGRAAYEVTPDFVPFTELGFDARIRDNPVDLSGYYRDSNGVIARAGSSFAFFGYFTGTLSAGYTERTYADARLPNLNGPTVNGSVAYAVTPLTTLTLSAATTVAETTLAGASGAFTRTFTAQVTHVFFRNFAVTAAATYQPSQYVGVSADQVFTNYSLRSVYSVTRDVQLIGSLSRQALTSSLPGNSFTDNIFLAGVRLQR